jgi:hypothetical protein
MKSSTKVFAALTAALAMFSQPAIATYVHADSKININNDLINLGIQNRKKLFGCSQAKPCIMDRIIIEGYKEVFSKDRKLQEVNIVLYNTSFVPAAIEVFSSDKKLKNVEFIDGAKAGFKDLGDYLKTASAGLVAPFQCTTNLFQCLIDDRYGIEKNERTIKLQPGDFISISNGSDAAFAYTLALSGIDQVELLASIPGITPSKVKKLSLLKNYSPALKRKIVEGFIKEKIKDKYTWEMLIKEFGYETYKKPVSNPKDLFNNALEVTQNIPQDFLKSMTDGTVASTVAGDVIDTLIQASSTEGAVFVNATLLVSQSVNSRARYVASEIAHKKPYGIFIAGLKNSSTNSDQPVAAKPIIKTVRMDNDKFYHCHERGSDKIQVNRANNVQLDRSSFKCELMKQENTNNPYEYVTTNKIINLFCPEKLSGGIIYDEGTIYQFVMTCKKSLIKTINSAQFRIGLVIAKEAQYGDIGTRKYWIYGNKKEKEVIFYENSLKFALMNINGQDVSLQLVNKKYENLEIGLVKTAVYKSQLYEVRLTDFKDITTAKDRKGCARRVRGFLEISSTDGLTKKLQIESAGDVCG